MSQTSGTRRPERQRSVYRSTRLEPNSSGLELGSSLQSYRPRRYRCRLPHLSFPLFSLTLELCCAKSSPSLLRFTASAVIRNYPLCSKLHRYIHPLHHSLTRSLLVTVLASQLCGWVPGLGPSSVKVN